MVVDTATAEEQQQIIRTSLRSMLQKYEPRREEFREMVDKQGIFPEELWRDYASVGLMGCLVPEEYGGNGAGLLALTYGFEEMVSQGFFPGLLLVTAMDAACIVRNAPEEIKRDFLPKICDGSLKLCFALTEPNAGTNTFRIQTVAKRDGDVYRINGQKVFITGVDVADYMLLVARTTTVDELKEQGRSKVEGLSLFLVDTKTKGIEKTRLNIPLNEGLRQFQLFLDDVEVPANHLIGEEDQGALTMFNSLNPERILTGAICAGMTDAALRKAVAYAKERVVFGDKPIGSYQSIAHPLAEVRIMLEAVRMMTYKAAAAYDAGRPPAEVGSLANMAKFLGADMAIKAADVALEVHGGNGFSEEFGLIQLWNGARLLKTAPISREMILNFVAEQNLGLPRSY
jgi:alkylation response protein AidB-like acyl-CoA dehydrogenase